MKKFLGVLFILMITLTGLDVFAQARNQQFCRMRDAITPAWQANVEALTSLTFATSKFGIYSKSALYGYDYAGAEFEVIDLVATQADGLALSLNGLFVSGVPYYYNGATLDMARSTANKGLQVGLESWHNSYDGANGWIDVQLKSTVEYAPPATTGTAVDATAGGDLGDIVIASFAGGQLGDLEVFAKNAGGGSGDNLLQCYALVSPTGAANTWTALTAWDSCSNLASGEVCSLELSGHAYIKVECICDTGDDTTVDAWVRGNYGGSSWGMSQGSGVLVDVKDMVAYNANADNISVVESNPVETKYTYALLVDVTNGTDAGGSSCPAGTNYCYYVNMTGKRKGTFQLILSCTAGTVTAKIYGTVQDDCDPDACDYEDITNDTFGVASLEAAAGSASDIWNDNAEKLAGYKYIYIDIDADTGGNTGDWRVDYKGLY